MCSALAFGQSITVNSTNYQQTIDMMGGDMERSSKSIQNTKNKAEMIQWGFGDIAFNVCRVQYDKNQELEEGTKNWAFYDKQVTTMQEIKAVNPNIEFFATLRSDYDGYGDNNNLPDWFCNYDTKEIDADKYGIFLADYVEYMDQQGVPIAMMSVAKEWASYVTAEVARDVIIKLENELTARGISIPLICDQGFWSLSAGINYVQDVESLGTEDLYGAFCSHDYAKQGLPKWIELESAVAAMGKTLYHDESSHGGGGPTYGAEPNITTPISAYVKKCDMYQAGVKGEAFFEIWSRGINKETRPIYYRWGGTGVRMRAYYIMKLFANNVVDSTYITSEIDSMDGVYTMAFRRNNQIALWVINEGATVYTSVPISMDASVINESVAATYWTQSTPVTGSTISYTASSANRFNVSIEAESINCYIFDVSLDKTNVALTGTATQSSTSHGADAGRAIDNNTHGQWSWTDDCSITHTQDEDQPWWQVDLGAPYAIDEIQIYNRVNECCIDRLSDYYVDILNCNGKIVWRNYQADYPNPSVSLEPGGIPGRYVLIQLRGSNVLSLAEVRVMSYGSAGFCGDLTWDAKVDMEDIAELSSGWQSDYTMEELLDIVNQWLWEAAPF